MITLALIGAGKWGRNYIRTIPQIKNCRLPDEYIRTRNYKDLFIKKDIDGVIIATPASSHFKIAKEFLDKGFNVLVEKPLATSLSEALDLKKIQEKAGLVAMVGHIYRYNPAFIDLAKRVKEIGDIKFIESQGMDFGPIRSDVSSLWDFAPHDISMITAILGNPVAVSAWGVNSISFIRLRFDSNLFSFTTVGSMSPVKKRNLTVAGKKEILFFDDLADKKLSIRSLEDNKTFYPQISNQPPLIIQILEFINSIKEKKDPKTNLDEGIMTVKVMEAAEKSIELNGKEVNIE